MSKVEDLNYEEHDDVILLDRYRAPEIYADGVSEIIMGYPMVKITLHTVMEAKEKEVRKSCAILTMDSPSALSMAFDILDAFKKAEQPLLNMASTAIVEKLKDLLGKIPQDKALSQLKEETIATSAKKKTKEKK